MIWNTDDPYLILRLTQDNRIIMGGRDVRFQTTRLPGDFMIKRQRS